MPDLGLCEVVLELIGEPLEPDRTKKLREWLSKGEAQTLRNVIGAKMRLAQEKALALGMKADGDNNSYDLKSMAEMKEAHRYQAALSVLDHVANPETTLETIKLKA